MDEAPLATHDFLASHIYERSRANDGPGRRREYFRLQLWESVDQLRRSTTAVNGVAIHCPTPEREGFQEGVWVKRPRRLLARINFAAGEWNDEIVAHELTHALFEADRSGMGATRIGDLVDAPFDHEEEWCYRFGRWFSTTYRWLWDNDPTIIRSTAE